MTSRWPTMIFDSSSTILRRVSANCSRTSVIRSATDVPRNRTGIVADSKRCPLSVVRGPLHFIVRADAFETRAARLGPSNGLQIRVQSRTKLVENRLQSGYLLVTKERPL